MAKTIYESCPEHFGCVRVIDEDSVRHEAADREARVATAGARGTIDQAKAEQDRLVSTQRKLKAQQEGLSKATKKAIGQAQEAESELQALQGRVTDLNLLLTKVQDYRVEIEAACVALLTRAQDELRVTQTLLSEREEAVRQRYEDFKERAEETIGALEDKLAEVRAAESQVIDRAKTGLKRIATDREYFQRALDELVRSAADVVERAKRAIK